ncbi:MAG: uroporphyrinogen decarboxylase family protein [Spirochaetota bacterium]
MTYKERTTIALRHEQPDRTPFHIDFTIPMREKMAHHFKDENFSDSIGNHLHYIRPAYDMTEVTPGIFRDEYGTIWDRTIDRDIGTVKNIVMNDTADLDKYVFPDPKKSGRFDHYDTAIRNHKDCFILARGGFSIFERAWMLRGMENLLCDMITNPAFVEELLDRITDTLFALIELAANHTIDGVMFGDDWGQQQGLIMGPNLWRKFIKPRIAKLYRKVKESDKKVFIHTCGDVGEIIPDLIEVGLDCLNPFQPEVFDVNKIKKQYGDTLSFFGGMSIQNILPFGTPEEVKAGTRKLIKEIGRSGGYICSPAHYVPGDVPVDNMLAMLDVLQNQ